MTEQTEKKAYDALRKQNYNRNPLKCYYLDFRSAYIVGDKVFLAREAAERWVKETRGSSKIETVHYCNLFEKFNNNESNL